MKIVDEKIEGNIWTSAKTWLEPRAFWIAFGLMAIVQINKITKNGFHENEVASLILACIGGGLFWGAIGTFLFRRFYKK